MPTETPKGEAAQKTARFEMAYSPDFRTVHADGAFGGLTPRGYISCQIYSERQSNPSAMHYPLKSDGGLGDELVEHREGFQMKTFRRQLECELMLDLPVAISLRDWLNDKIATLTSRIEKGGAS